MPAGGWAAQAFVGLRTLPTPAAPCSRRLSPPRGSRRRALQLHSPLTERGGPKVRYAKLVLETILPKASYEPEKTTTDHPLSQPAVTCLIDVTAAERTRLGCRARRAIRGGAAACLDKPNRRSTVTLLSPHFGGNIIPDSKPVFQSPPADSGSSCEKSSKP